MDVQATLNQFVTNNNNKGLDFDGQYGCQCVDEIQFWAKALGKRPFSGNAINVPGQNADQWTWIHNSPSAVPSPGDIICFAANTPAIGTGPYGHVDVFLSGDVNSFTALDQNWAGVQRCEQVHHASYAGVLGFMRPIEVAPTPTTHNVEAIHATNVRTAPTTAAPVGGSGLLQPGNTFTATGLVTGQNVAQNGVTSNQWWHSTLGHYVWSGNCKEL